MLSIFSRLFGGGGDSAAAPAAVSSDCSKCGLPLVDCKCCYVCGAENRLTCVCAVSRSATAQAILDYEESEDL